MDNNSFSTNFFIRRDKKDRSVGTIFVRITVNGEWTEHSLKEKIKASLWEPKAEIVIGKMAQAKATNEHIDSVRYRLRQAYRQLEENDCIIGPSDVKETFLGKHKLQKNQHTLVELIQKHETERFRHLKDGTTKNYGATLIYVKNFLQHKYGKPDIHLSALDFEFITEFENFIPDHPIKAWDPCKGNGIAKHIERLKKIVAWGKKLKWLKENPFEDFSPHKTRTRRKKLKIHQLVAIGNQVFHLETLNYVRDLFIYSCYTGLSFSDVMKISMEDFIVSSSGKFLCTIYRTKSEEFAPVPVLQTAVNLIRKYKDLPKSIANGTIFPPISNQEVNRCLKIIQAVCGISTILTFHLARHTFAYVVSLKNGFQLKRFKSCSVIPN